MRMLLALLVLASPALGQEGALTGLSSVEPVSAAPPVRPEGDRRCAAGGAVCIAEATYSIRIQVANGAINDQAGPGFLHDVVGEVVADERAVFVFAEEINYKNVTRLQLVDDPLILSAGIFLFFAFRCNDLV